jgi:predicted RNase H-like HicB family nuclease
VISQYVGAALRKARYEILSDDGTFYGEIEGFAGVYANAATLEECREELREVLEEWILFRVSRNLRSPSSTATSWRSGPRRRRSLRRQPRLLPAAHFWSRTSW